MDSNLTNKLYELITLIDDSILMKDLIDLKQQIEKDEALNIFIKAFENAKNDYAQDNNKQTIDNLIKSKKSLYDVPLVQQYKTKEQELNKLVSIINNKLKQLIDQKKCYKQTSS